MFEILYTFSVVKEAFSILSLCVCIAVYVFVCKGGVDWVYWVSDAVVFAIWRTGWSGPAGKPERI